MKILHITDPHLYGSASGTLRGVVTDASLRSVLDEAHGELPDAAATLVTGDLVQDDASGYLRFCSILGSSPRPVLCIPGNHDEPVIMRRSLARAPFQVCGTYCAGGWQIVLLDSCDPGHAGGRLSGRELERLDRTLGTSPAHAMVCLHHHPVLMQSRWMDGIGLANAGEFWRVIDSHRQVRAVVWGHVHQEFEDVRGSVRLFSTPSTGAQFLPRSERYAVDSRPPAYRRFTLHPDGRIDSEVRWVVPTGLPRAASGAG